MSITPSAIGMWEQGRREPDYETLESLADFFNVDIDFLIGRTDYTTRLVGKDSILNAQVVREERAGYYTNPEVAKLAQEIYENPDLRILLDASRDVSKEDLELVAEMVKKLKKTNRD